MDVEMEVESVTTFSSCWIGKTILRIVLRFDWGESHRNESEYDAMDARKLTGNFI